MINWSTAKDGVLDEVLRTSETYLEGTVTIATSADQRAAVVAGTFATAGAAIVAGLMWFSATVTAENHYASAIYTGGGLAAFFFLLGAFLCIRAAMPVGFNLPGTQPSGWESDIAAGRELKDCQYDLLNFREDLIAKNLATIKRNAGLFKYGAYSGIAAPFIGAAAWALIANASALGFARRLLCG